MVRSCAWLNAMMPSVPVAGNHEQAKLEDGTRRLSHHWQPSFTLPADGPKGLEETCYTLVYHNLRIISLNSNEMQAEQVAWLDQVLEENTSTWVVCTFHHPIFSTGKDRDNAELRALWKPVFDKYRVDLVLQGHDHTYGRSGLNVPASIEAAVERSVAAELEYTPAGVAQRCAQLASTVETLANVPVGVQHLEPEQGTVYVVSVSGPKMYQNKRPEFMKRLGEDTQLYQIIHIDGDVLRFEARTAIGELYDAFELVKQPGDKNRLVEISPEVPENLRAIDGE